MKKEKVVKISEGQCTNGDLVKDNKERLRTLTRTVLLIKLEKCKYESVWWMCGIVPQTHDQSRAAPQFSLRSRYNLYASPAVTTLGNVSEFRKL